MCAVVLTVMLPVAACDSGDDGRLDLGSLPPTTGATTTVAVNTPTTAAVAPETAPTTPATTVAPVTVAPATTTTTTTLAPTTTIAIEDQVRADFLADREAWFSCFYAPEACDYEFFAVPGSELDMETRTKFGDWLGANLRAVQGHGDIQSRVESVDVADGHAFVIVCTYDTLVVYDVGNPEDASDDVVFDDTKVSHRVRWLMTFVEGRWLLAEGDGLEERHEEDLCEF